MADSDEVSNQTIFNVMALIQAGKVEQNLLNQLILVVNGNSSLPSSSRVHPSEEEEIHRKLVQDCLIPTDNETWAFYINLRNILCILKRSVVEEKDVRLLEKLISKHNTAYIRLFSDTLKPKHHYLVHYARILRLIGPLWSISCMRYEAKHKKLKEHAAVVRSRKNIAYTLALNQQLIFSQRLATQKGFEERFLHGPQFEIAIRDYDDYEQFCDIIPEQLTENTVRFTWVQFNGTDYKEQMVVCLKHENEIFVYGQIKYILSTSSRIFFLVKKLDTLRLYEHNHAFEVIETNIWACVTQEDLLFPKPTNLYKLSN